VTPTPRTPGKPPERGKAKVILRGQPHRVSSLLPLPEDPAALEATEVRLEGADVRGHSLRPLVREGEAIGKLTLRLPRSTPPGTYSGSVEVGGNELPIVAEVEPRPRLETDPPRLAFDAEPGEEVTAEVTLLNTGNVPWEVPGASSFCVFDGSGVDHAFWAALASDPPEGKQRVDVLLDDLAESHGGLVQVRARPRGRRIAPGESRDVQITLRFSDRIRAGRAYAGSWEADGLRLRVRVSVPDRKPRSTAKEAR
jgi:hypothetical protein